MTEWVGLALNALMVLGSVLSAGAMVVTRLARLEGRLDMLGVEIRKDREIAEHRIRQLEIGLAQVRDQLHHLSYAVGRHTTQKNEVKHEG
jgi:hypothetical protein